MTGAYVARVECTINAGPVAVWQALTDPELVQTYMHGTHLSTDWRVGSPITWQGEWNGRSYEDKGKVLTVEPEHLLRYTHWSSMSGDQDVPENYHTITYTLTEDGQAGTILTLEQDNNETEEQAKTMAESNWTPVLNGLKDEAERVGGQSS